MKNPQDELKKENDIKNLKTSKNEKQKVSKLNSSSNDSNAVLKKLYLYN